jgi:hypothetical protein
VKTLKPLPITCFLLALSFLPGCSSERRDRLWETIDPVGYKHAHSESFNGARALRSPQPKTTSADGNSALELDQ